MKTSILLLALLLVSFASFALEVDDAVTVHIRSTPLRATPGHLGRPVAEVAYESVGIVTEVQVDWIQVRFEDLDLDGWIHASAVQEPKAARGLSLLGRGTTRSTTAGATTDEVALAGRGFNDKVEAQYKEDTGLDFSEVDRMEDDLGQNVDVLGEFFASAGLGFPEATE